MNPRPPFPYMMAGVFSLFAYQTWKSRQLKKKEKYITLLFLAATVWGAAAPSFTSPPPASAGK